jgi:peptidoglycan/xylan/chitin deacetylase (PgdA/CDA1 family)
MIVLCVHDIVPADPASTWTVTEREIEAVVGACRRQGYVFVGLDDFSAAPKESVVLTADDGRSGAISWLLRKAPALGISATAFVVPGWIDNPQAMPGTERYSDIAEWDQVAALRAVGHTIGSHGRSHVRLPPLTAERLTSEIAGSKSRIQTAVGADTRHFAAPYGHISDAVVHAARHAGHQTISTTIPGVNDPQECHAGILRRYVLRRDRPALGLPPGWSTT